METEEFKKMLKLCDEIYNLKKIFHIKIYKNQKYLKEIYTNDLNTTISIKQLKKYILELEKPKNIRGFKSTEINMPLISGGYLVIKK